MKKIMQLLGLTSLGLMTTLTMNSAQAKQTFCVFDLVGTQGDVYALMKDYQLASKQWGADIELKAYTDERVLTEDFKLESVTVRVSLECVDANSIVSLVQSTRSVQFQA